MLWTPSVLIMDPKGKERVRNEGYQPKDEFRAWLDMGLARLDFVAKKWAEAESRFDGIVKCNPDLEVAAYSVYWRGASSHKQSHDHKALSAVDEEFRHKYQESSWAKKSAVWGNEKQHFFFRSGTAKNKDLN